MQDLGRKFNKGWYFLQYEKGEGKVQEKKNIVNQVAWGDDP